ncbi:Multidrug resistance protein MdtC [Aquisphaera giovannonii]|uniref:Multidrug resistance protein MdtC n=1 Tax=Aquisphaera giovannonii TaxID=406548 RepID=A0A5B9VZS9_9BACT|nr:efflux RND transporter permease subunit [Aquisphaera giovannonii]QEH33454.1 Multidrug resistance protein MdtC [Aquisphaera giovannonii]
MNGLIRASLGNPYAVTVMALTMVLLGALSVTQIPVDILPIFRSPAVQTLTFYGGMSANSIAHDITNRMERWTGQANGMARQESRSILGASIVRNYFQGDVDPNGALTQVNSLALAAIPNLPPGTLPPVVLPFDPTSTTPVCVVALDSEDPANNESVLYDVGRYEVRNMIMGQPGAVAPVVYGGKVRAVMAYLDRNKMQARDLSTQDVLAALNAGNVFLPTGDAKFGDLDYVIDSNSMYEKVEDMGDIPVRIEPNNATYLRDVAQAKDANYIQTNVVRVNGKREVYIPVFRQLGSSTLRVVENLRGSLRDMEAKLTRSGINLKLVMDQSVYVRKSIEALVQEGVLGAILCSLVILMFLGEWRMTGIAVMTLPLACMTCCACLFLTGQTINTMTLAGMTLAIGPMIDSAIICLENTHRHMGLGASPRDAAFLGASEVAMPELVSTLCTFLVLSPLVMTPGLGQFLFKPMAMAVAFSMIAAYLLSRTLVPACSAFWLKPHAAHAHDEHGHGDQADGHGDPAESETFQINGDGPKPRRRGAIARAFARWEAMIDRGIEYYVKGLDAVLRHPALTLGFSFTALAATILLFWPILRKEFFPEVDAGAFEMYVRAPSGLRIERMEDRIKEVEKFVKETVEEEDLELVLSELGVTSDWSAAYTPNAGPMDAVVRVQLSGERKKSAQEYVAELREGFASRGEFSDLEFAFDAGGMVRSAMNEGKSTPISVRITAKDQKSAHRVASMIRNEVEKVPGVVDARIIQRLDYPQFMVKVDRAKSAQLGLTQADVMKAIIASLNSSIQFDKHNFWIDPKSKNQYYVGVSYAENEIKSLDTIYDIPITSPVQKRPVPMRNVIEIERVPVPTEVTHYNIQPTIELSMGVAGRDLGHVSDDVSEIIGRFGRFKSAGQWDTYKPDSDGKELLVGSRITLSGEYLRMKDTFNSLGVGLILASLLIYFLMVGLDRSFVVPLTVMAIVPLSLIGIMPMLYVTKSAVNVQSLLGFIFIVGIKVANSVLMTDYAQELRRHEGLTPLEAIRKAASLRVRPITMTALAAFFALVPGALSLERGSEANAPLARAILGGLIAGEPATLFVLPVIYSLIVRDKPGKRLAPAHEGESEGDRPEGSSHH